MYCRVVLVEQFLSCRLSRTQPAQLPKLCFSRALLLRIPRSSKQPAREADQSGRGAGLRRGWGDTPAELRKHRSIAGYTEWMKRLDTVRDRRPWRTCDWA